MTEANHASTIRIKVPTIKPDEILATASPADYDDIAQLRYDTLARIADNVTEGIKEVAGYTENWSYARDAEPGSYAVFSIQDTSPWDNPLIEILRDDPAVADWTDNEIRNLASMIRATALRSTHTSCATLDRYDSYDVQARVQRTDEHKSGDE